MKIYLVSYINGTYCYVVTSNINFLISDECSYKEISFDEFYYDLMFLGLVRK